MSQPYPHDRARARQDQGEQPYKDAREAMTEKDARLQAQAEEYGEANVPETDEERLARLEEDAKARLIKVNTEISQAERNK